MNPQDKRWFIFVCFFQPMEKCIAMLQLWIPDVKPWLCQWGFMNSFIKGSHFYFLIDVSFFNVHFWNKWLIKSKFYQTKKKQRNVIKEVDQCWTRPIYGYTCVIYIQTWQNRALLYWGLTYPLGWSAIFGFKQILRVCSRRVTSFSQLRHLELKEKCKVMSYAKK